jgi:MFS-type transporter involved in bile tolerance (Atg22 family)
MFYAFAALKTPGAAATSLGKSTVLTVLSMALILQAILMPIVGSWCDRHGALSVMRIGFLTGAAGIAGLGFAGAVPVPTMICLAGCFLVVGTGLAMSTYEVAFSAAV